ncbi:MAG: hypothetical protein JRG83_13755 [Deltaproteobacteria bacterium]|nr:hypothetical protein [Deltaproteobacteria bacterium]
MSSPADTQGGVAARPDSHKIDSRKIEEAVQWLREVDGRLMCKSQEPRSPDGWVAIVRTPAATGRSSQVIIGFGDSALTAVETAQESWDDAWREVSALH